MLAEDCGLSSIHPLYGTFTRVGRHRPCDGVGTTCVGHSRMAERIPSMDAGYDCPMDEVGRAMRECRGSATHQHRARTMQIHFLLQTLAGGTASLLHRQVRPDECERLRTETVTLRSYQHG